jgi:hypothetical protein
VGRYVVIRGQTGRRFFSIITDVALDSTNPTIEKAPPDTSDDFLASVHQGTSTFGRLEVSPMLVLDRDSQEPKPVKTVPAHFAPVYEATEEDVNHVFGAEDDRHFYVGAPLDMEKVRVHLDLGRFVERSSGVFGKSGTGKTFLTRTLLAGIIKQGSAVNLIFDMHNEYGWESQAEGKHKVKGLRQLFPGKVGVMTLDPESSRRRSSKVDFEVCIGYDQIEPEDVDMLSDLMGLTEVQVGALYYLRRRLGRSWIDKLLAEGQDDQEGPTELDMLLEEGKLHGGTLGAIQRKLGLFRRFGFLQPSAGEDVVSKIMEYLDKEIHVILEFGRYGSTLEAYILVANYPPALRVPQGGGAGPGAKRAHAPGHHHRGGPQVPGSRHRPADHFRHHRPRAAQVQCDPADRGPAAQRHRRRGHEPDRHPRHRPPRQRARHPGGLYRRIRRG